MAWTLVDSDAIGFADGNAGHVYNLPDGAPAAGELDVLCVNSDTVVSTPSGFEIAEQAVANQGSYIFYRIAAGSEGDSVTITTSGDFNCQATWSRWTGADAVDVTTSVQANASFASATPAIDTGALAETGELVIAFGAIHGAVTTSPSWSAGYTPMEAMTQGSGGSTATGYTAYRTDAGTAAETPQVSWTTAAPDRYMLVATFTPGAGDATVTPASVDAVAAIPAVTVSTGATATPGAVQAVATVPTPDFSTGQAVTPGTLAAVATLPTPTISTGQTVAPESIAAVADVLAPSLVTQTVVTPAVIAAVAAVLAPALSTGSIVTPGVVAAVTTVPTPIAGQVIPFGGYGALTPSVAATSALAATSAATSSLLATTSP